MKTAISSACLLLTGLLGGCTGAPAPPWQVEVAGCESWAASPAGPACAIGKDKLRIWVGGAESFKVELDDERMLLQAKKVAGGQRFELQVPSTATRLRLLRAGAEPFKLPFTSSQRPAWYPKIMEVYQRGDEASRRLGQLADGPAGELKGGELGWKRYFEARLANRRGDRQAAIALSAQSAELWADPLPGQALAEWIFAAEMLNDDAEFDQAQQKLAGAVRLLDGMQSRGLVPWRPAFLVADLQANLALATGDVRTALAHWEKLDASVAHEILTRDEIFSIADMEVRILAELGRFTEALARLERLGELKLEPELEAHRLHNYGWLALLARMAGQPAEDPAPFFARAYSYYQQQEGRELEKLITLLNQASAELLAGRPRAAREFLATAESLRGQAGAAERFDFQELEAQLRLAEGDAKASLELFQRLDIEASRRRLPGASWRALVGKAQAMAAAGWPAAAIETFERAERLEGQELMFIPIDQGRETFLARREGTTRQHLELLLAEHRPAEAHQLVRRHRVQTLRLLHRDERLATVTAEQRGSWNRAAAEYRRRLRQLEAEIDQQDAAGPRQSRRLDPGQPQGGAELAQLLDRALALLGLPAAAAAIPPPPEGELTLAFFPLENSWLLFAESGEGKLRVVTSRHQDLVAAAAELLGQVVSEIDASRRLKLLPWGELDFHALEVEGKLLIARKPVVYGLDAGARPPAPPRPASPAGAPAMLGQALLVGDTLSLRRPRSELEMAGKILEGRGFELGAVLLGEEAKAPRVREELERADYFHFAGHSIFDLEAGSQSRLSLRGGELKASDVFTLRRVPARVLLSSCSGGQASRASGVEGLGLAQAFILAGSRQVLATTREVDDRDAADLIAALYRHLDAAGGDLDLAAALRLAQIERSRVKSDSDWQAFRVFEP